MHCAGVVSAGATGGGCEVTVGFVDHDEIGQLHDSALDSLEFIAAGGGDEQGEKIDHVGDSNL
ncbi:unannotated protein [freshwater metagenome]|uniref:Unannotated protein n=1 Tax=freshwater metagenome TaxID=449393 RepID=A0A6J5YA40_9ZZZZ